MKPDAGSGRTYSWWSREQRLFSVGEMIADGLVHGVALVAAIVAGSFLLYFTWLQTAPDLVPAIALYVTTLISVLAVSFAYNLWPASPIKKLLARLDQAAIFLFIAGTYTPFLALLSNTPTSVTFGTFVWGTALVGMALKLLVPERFGRMAIALYLLIGWSGVFIFRTLAATLPDTTLLLLLAGGLAYSAGIIFHLWERLKFQNAVWHGFVTLGAGLHLWAVFDCMVLTRL